MASFSTYGGIKADRHAATGYFHTEKSGRRWWLIDPEGYPFIHVGVVDLKFPKGSGTREEWAAATTELLHANGFNGAGAWFDTDLLRASKRPVTYSKIWNFMASMAGSAVAFSKRRATWATPRTAFSFSIQRFVPFCDDYAKRLSSTKDDPWLLGHFSDNELPFYSKTLTNFLTLPPDDAGRQSGRSVARGTPREASRRARHHGRDAAGLFSATSPSATCRSPRRLCANTIPITFASVRVLTSRRCNQNPCLKRAGRHLDVIAVNYYHAWSPDPMRTSNWVKWSGKPFLVTEWYAKGMDSGFSNTTGAGWVVKTQADRGRFYQNFTLGLLESGGCVGWHWFKYRDNDPTSKTADPSNLDSNKGIVNLRLEPYAPLLQAMRELNQQVYALAAYFDRRAK